MSFPLPPPTNPNNNQLLSQSTPITYVNLLIIFGNYQSDPHLDGTDSLKRQIECTRALVVDETAAAASASVYAGLLIEWLAALPEPVIPTKF